jgi:hypothetical protein
MKLYNFEKTPEAIKRRSLEILHAAIASLINDDASTNLPEVHMRKGRTRYFKYAARPRKSLEKMVQGVLNLENKKE